MKGLAIVVLAAFIAISSAYPQSNWDSQSQANNGQWGGWDQSSQQGQSSSGQQNHPQIQAPSDNHKDDESDKTLNEIKAAIGTAIVAINGSVYYKIEYSPASNKTGNQDQSSQKPNSNQNQN